MMLTPLRLRSLWLLAFLLPCLLRAQPATGLIEGRVLNAANGNYLEGARVSIEGTSLETFTDADGHYLLAAVPVGEAMMAIVLADAFLRHRAQVGAGVTWPFAK